MKDLRFSKYTSDLDGLLLVDSDGSEYRLVIDEPLLRKLDKLLLDREGQSPPMPAARQAPPSDTASRLESVPKSPDEAISAVREWHPSGNGTVSSISVEEALISNLKSRMVQLPSPIFDESWAGERRKGGGWIVSFSFLLAGQPRVAEWIVDDVKREVRSGNPLSEELQVYDLKKSKAAQADKSKARLGRRRRA